MITYVYVYININIYKYYSCSSKTTKNLDDGSFTRWEGAQILHDCNRDLDDIEEWLDSPFWEGS